MDYIILQKFAQSGWMSASFRKHLAFSQRPLLLVPAWIMATATHPIQLNSVPDLWTWSPGQTWNLSCCFPLTWPSSLGLFPSPGQVLLDCMLPGTAPAHFFTGIWLSWPTEQPSQHCSISISTSTKTFFRLAYLRTCKMCVWFSSELIFIYPWVHIRSSN